MKKTKTNERIFHVHGLEELILLKCPYYPKQSIDSMHSLSKFQVIFHRTRRNISKIFMEPWKIPNSQNNLEKEEESWNYHAP